MSSEPSTVQPITNNRASSAKIHDHNSPSISILMAIFPGLSGTRKSPFWILLELRMTEEVVTTGAITSAKAGVKSSPPTNQHPTLYRSNTLPVTLTRELKAGSAFSIRVHCAVLSGYD